MSTQRNPRDEAPAGPICKTHTSSQPLTMAPLNMDAWVAPFSQQNHDNPITFIYTELCVNRSCL